MRVRFGRVRLLACSLAIAACALLAPTTMAGAARGVITTVVGGIGDGGAATSANLGPWGVAFDARGDLYIADSGNCRVRRVRDGRITTVVGTGACGDSGDGGPAESAELNGPAGLAFDTNGNLYIADYYNCRVRKVSGRIITTVAGTGTCGYGGDNGSATSAELNNPAGVAVEASGDLLIADSRNCRVRKVSDGTITTVAGTGGCGRSETGDTLRPTTGVAVDTTGNLYIADYPSCRVRKLTGVTITTVAGNGHCGYRGDGGPATDAELKGPYGVALDESGNLYIADIFNCRVRKVSDGTITTIAGNGTCGYGGDGGAATSAALYYPINLTLDASGDLYIGDQLNCRVRKVSDGTITTVAGTGSCGYSGDGGPPANAAVNFPRGVLLDTRGNLYIADTNNCRIRKVSDGTITTVAGTGTCGYSGDGGLATSAELFGPRDLALDARGDLYIADTYNCRVRMVSHGIITTIAGIGVGAPHSSIRCGYSGDGGAAASAQLSYPEGIALDKRGNLYIADRGNCRVRKVSDGTITTIAGNGTCGYGGDGGAATSAELSHPEGVALDARGNLYIADTRNCRVRKLSEETISTVAGTGTCGYSGEGGLATSAALNHPGGVALDARGSLYIADSDNCRVRKLSGDEIMTVAGGSTCTYAGDGSAATSAALNRPSGVAIDARGNLYIADTYNGRVREVLLSGPPPLPHPRTHRETRSHRPWG